MRHRAVVVSLLLVSMLVIVWVVAPSGSFSFVLRNPIVLVQNLFRATAAPRPPAPSSTLPPAVPIPAPTGSAQTGAPTPSATNQPLISVPEVPLPVPGPLPGGIPQPSTGVPGGVTPPGGVGGPGPSGPPSVPDPKGLLPKLP